MNNWRKIEADKPYSKPCYHFFDDSRKYSYVGAVWLDNESNKWVAHCCCSPPLYGHLGDFESEAAATECLERRVAGDVIATGENGE